MVTKGKRTTPLDRVRNGKIERLCSGCSRWKPRRALPLREAHDRYRVKYVNEYGKLWHGTVCNECRSAYCGANVKKARAK